MLRIGTILSRITVTGLDGPSASSASGSRPAAGQKQAADAANLYAQYAQAVEQTIPPRGLGAGFRPAQNILTSGLDAEGGSLGRSLQGNAASAPGAPGVWSKGRLGGGGLTDAGSVRGLMQSSSSQSIPIQARSQLEGYFGSSFGDVRLHTDSAAQQAADSIGAKAFTFGNDIFLGSQAPSLNSPEGSALLGHELTHVMQFRQEPTAAAPRTSDGPLNQRYEQAAADVEENILKTLRNPATTGSKVSVAQTSITFANGDDLSRNDRARAERIAHKAVRRAETMLEGRITPGAYEETIGLAADVDLGIEEEAAVTQLAERIAVRLKSVATAPTTAGNAPSTPMASPIEGVAADPIEERRKYFAFGEELPDEPKTLDQLMAERIEKEKAGEGGYWLDRARQEILSGHLSVSQFQELVNERDNRVRQWIYDAGPSPKVNPIANSQIADSFKAAAKVARRAVARIHKTSGSADDFHRDLQLEQNRLLTAQTSEEQKAGRVIALYLSSMNKRAKAAIYESDPDLAKIDELYQAARLYLEQVPVTPPKVKLPSSATPLGDLSERHLSVAKGDLSEQAKAIARNVVQVARQRGTVSDQYHFVESMIVEQRHAGNPAQILASQILQRYLIAEKKKWVTDYVEDLLFQETPAQPSWSLLDEVTRADDEKTPLPQNHRQWRRIENAWERITRILSPAVLDKIGPVAVRVHKNPLFRAHYTGHKKEIHIAPFESMDITMHEFGHHLEDQGGLEAWARVQKLLHGRHGGGNLKRLWMQGLDEMGFSADMPVTGSYSAKYYAHGSTEIISMGMEYFATKEKAAQLYMEDPEMFLAVLKAARG